MKHVSKEIIADRFGSYQARMKLVNKP